MEEAIRLYYRGEIHEAEKFLKRLIAREPDNTIAQIRLAEIKKELGNLKEAGEIYLSLAHFFEKKKNYEECLEFLEKALPCLSQTEISPVRGRCLFQLGQYAEALSDLIISPRDNENLFYKGKCYFFLNQYNNALRIFREIFSTASDTVELLRAHYWIGKSLYALGEMEDAISCFESYVSVYSKEKQVYLDLAICYLNSGLLDKAHGNLLEYQRLGGSEDLTYFYLGIICYRQGNYRKAIELLDKTSLTGQALHWKGLACYELALYEDALENFTKAAKYETKPLYLKMMGNSNLKLGRFFEAKICYEKALGLDPADEDILGLIALSERLLKTE